MLFDTNPFVYSSFFIVSYVAAPGQLWANVKDAALPSIHHCHILIQPVGHCKPHDEVGSQNLIELISGIRIGNLWMLNLTHYPIALVTPFLRVYSMKYNYLIGLIPDLRFVKNKCICFVGFCQFHISS